MTQKEIIRMAREANNGKVRVWQDCHLFYTDELERFFNLAFEAGATQEREKIEPAWRQSIEYAKLAEREACAKLVLDDAWALTFQTFGQYRKALAAAIRARGENAEQ